MLFRWSAIALLFSEHPLSSLYPIPSLELMLTFAFPFCFHIFYFEWASWYLTILLLPILIFPSISLLQSGLLFYYYYCWLRWYDFYCLFQQNTSHLKEVSKQRLQWCLHQSMPNFVQQKLKFQMCAVLIWLKAQGFTSPLPRSGWTSNV